MAQVEKCGICNGKRYIPCPICDGRGKVKKETKSANVNIFGLGEETVGCQTCQATGRLLCKACGGAGKILIEKSGSTGFSPFS